MIQFTIDDQPYEVMDSLAETIRKCHKYLMLGQGRRAVISVHPWKWRLSGEQIKNISAVPPTYLHYVQYGSLAGWIERGKRARSDRLEYWFLPIEYGGAWLGQIRVSGEFEGILSAEWWDDPLDCILDAKESIEAAKGECRIRL